MIRHRIDAHALTLALRSGVADVVAENDLPGLSDAVARSHQLHRSQLTSAAPSKSQSKAGAIVTVFSAKGGCGKTTVSTNLAVHIASRSEQRVVLVDLDLAFGDVAITMQLQPVHTIEAAIELRDSIDSTAVNAMLSRHPSGVQVLTAPSRPAASDQITPELVARILTVLRTEFDVVVVDCPPALDERVLACLDVTTSLIMLTTLDVPALKNLALAQRTVVDLGFDADNIRIALNRADSKVGLRLPDVESTLGTNIDVLIPSSIDVPTAANAGEVLTSAQPRHPVSCAIGQLAELVTSAPMSTSPSRERRSWIRRAS